MSAFGHKRSVYLNTYGRQKRKVERWFSPELRKQAFSFSSTLSSDLSTPEHKTSKKRRKNENMTSVASRTSRVAKKRAIMAMREQESDDENNFVRDTSSRRTMSTNPVKRAAVTRKRPGMDAFAASKSELPRGQMMKRRKKTKKQVVFSSSDDESFVTRPKPSTAPSPSTVPQGKHAEARVSAGPAPLGRFVTRRRRALLVQSVKHTTQRSSGTPNGTLNSSGEFVHPVSFARRVTRRKQAAIREEFYLESSDAKPSAESFGNPQTRSGTALREISLNDGEERREGGKRPLLCSTPSLSFARHLRLLEPSVSEISSLSCDEAYRPPAEHDPGDTGRHSRRSRRTLARFTANRAHQRREAEKIGGFGDGTEESEEEPEKSKRDHGEDQKSRRTGLVSAQAHLDVLVEQLKEQCCSMGSVVLLEEMDILSNPSKQSCSEIEAAHVTDSPHVRTEPSIITAYHGHQSRDLSSDCPDVRPLCLTSSTSSPSAPSALELPALVDCLKVECLSSCLTVSLRPLDPSILRRAQKGPGDAWVALPLPPESGSDCRAEHDVPPLKNPPELSHHGVESLSGSEVQTAGLRRRLSASFLRSGSSPEPGAAPGKMLAPRDRNGTGRKACVSGLSATRWSKKVEQNRKHRKNESTTRPKPVDSSLNDLLPAAAQKHTGESYGWMHGTSGFVLPVTPVRAEQLNLSSILANFTPDALTTHSWGRLKAALSIHKKKTAFPTPRWLAMSKLQSPCGMDTSLDLFSTPLSKLASSRLPRTTLTNTPMAVCDEDISDAEKVYLECHQDGPLSFERCIPPQRMDLCRKIGEGTFGEVFSTVDDSNQTVALKIIPVEGCHKVNGEPQKTFGEILHEIIISKELSSLNSKETNKTNGFIGLNDLHCVRGCYPWALLRAWDKFDQEKGSENDRPDFFGEDQLFVILEFEFGGSDLENMNGKLSSMTQAKSILHQVTAALAVAEQALCFEHRDLHWGNILVKTTKHKNNEFILNGSVHSVDTRGVHVNVIDYSLSRLEIDGLTVSCDIANDEELFLGQGDYQFEIYRLMRKENNNCWSEYNPHSNVLWLHYLADKLLAMRYKTKAQSSQLKAVKNNLQAFRSEILSFSSATDALLHCSLFR
ncbi:uncharacterized protein LOC143518570 [Brachyhypopomus gauderio]|uniref:uncharacterized protein LOC143518570 n=1 Tax=Brachyhypopomus gauderio TaxID=698409 RepID=UPI004040FEE7